MSKYHAQKAYAGPLEKPHKSIVLLASNDKRPTHQSMCKRQTMQNASAQ